MGNFLNKKIESENTHTENTMYVSDIPFEYINVENTTQTTDTTQNALNTTQNTDTTNNSDVIIYMNYSPKSHILAGSFAPGDKFSYFREDYLKAIKWIMYNPYLKIPGKKGWVLPSKYLYNIIELLNLKEIPFKIINLKSTS